MMDDLLEEMSSNQRVKLLSIAREILAFCTPDDILQPQDFPELEENPLFRYEEGVLAGIEMVKIAIRNQGEK